MHRLSTLAFLRSAVIGILTNNCYLLPSFTSKRSFFKGCFFLFPSFCLETKGATYADAMVAGESQKFKPIQSGHSLRTSVVSVNRRLQPPCFGTDLWSKSPLRDMQDH
jgi:hypothetical protein